jgi:hypothetical protein
MALPPNFESILDAWDNVLVIEKALNNFISLIIEGGVEKG